MLQHHTEDDHHTSQSLLQVTPSLCMPPGAGPEKEEVKLSSTRHSLTLSLSVTVYVMTLVAKRQAALATSLDNAAGRLAVPILFLGHCIVPE